jgi:hypothetical protein
MSKFGPCLPSSGLQFRGGERQAKGQLCILPTALLIWTGGSLCVTPPHRPCHEHLWFNQGRVSSPQRLLLQRTGFYSNKSTQHSHTDPNVLSSSTPASQELTQAFPKPRSPCDVFLADKGSPAELRGIPMAALSCRSSLMVHQ